MTKKTTNRRRRDNVLCARPRRWCVWPGAESKNAARRVHRESAAARFVVVGVVPPPSAPRPSVVRPPTADRRRPSPPPRPVRPFNNVRRRSRPSAADARSFADPPVAPVRPHDDDDDEFVYDRAYRCAGRSFVGAFHTVENKTKNAHENFEQNEKVSLF